MGLKLRSPMLGLEAKMSNDGAFVIQQRNVVLVGVTGAGMTHAEPEAAASLTYLIPARGGENGRSILREEEPGGNARADAIRRSASLQPSCACGSGRVR